MKAYICDSCHKPITDPHFFKMKEFYYTWEYDTIGPNKVSTSTKYKIHLCDDCFRGLKEIGKRSLEEK